MKRVATSSLKASSVSPSIVMLVVVVDPAQVGELQVAGQGGRLAGDALHHAAVAGQGVDVVVEHLEAGPVEVLRHPLAGDRHPDAGGDALAERARGRLDARGPAILGMARQRLSSWRKRLMSSSVTESSPRVSYFGLTALTPVRWSIE